MSRYVYWDQMVMAVTVIDPTNVGPSKANNLRQSIKTMEAVQMLDTTIELAT